MFIELPILLNDVQTSLIEVVKGKEPLSEKSHEKVSQKLLQLVHRTQLISNVTFSRRMFVICFCFI